MFFYKIKLFFTNQNYNCLDLRLQAFFIFLQTYNLVTYLDYIYFLKNIVYIFGTKNIFKLINMSLNEVKRLFIFSILTLDSEPDVFFVCF